MINRREFMAYMSGIAAWAGFFIPALKAWAKPDVGQPASIDDASKLSETPVHRIIKSGDEDILRAALKEALAEKKTVSVARIRHSMGGQAIPVDNGIAIELPAQDIVIAEDRRTYTASGGATWHNIIEQLHAHGLSPAVMQSNDDFSVGGTLSVNAHGWPAPFGPFASTVRSFRLMKADGSVVNCSRTENEELFSLTIGGYGLFGIVLDAQLDAVPNSFLNLKQKVLPTSKFSEYFMAAVRNDPTVRMAYGRMSVSSDNFLGETIASIGQEVPAPAGGMPPLRKENTRNSFLRGVYMMQKDSDLGKKMRWRAEKQVATSMTLEFSRNSLLYTPVSVFQNADKYRTDILHEYFVPPDRFNDFVNLCRDIIPQHQQELMNVTLRYVAKDVDSVLSYAPDERLCLVMLFLQRKTSQDEVRMEEMTRRLIDATHTCGGGYYLPYRLHASQEQFNAHYPRTQEFFAQKKKHDPDGLFSNAFMVKYGPR